MCVIQAIKNSINLDRDYFLNLLNNRLISNNKQTYIQGITNAKWLSDVMLISEWHEIDHINVRGNCKSYIAYIPGKSKMKLIEDNDIISYYQDTHTNKIIAVVNDKNCVGKEFNFSTIILGNKNANEVVLNFYPGNPVSAKSDLAYLDKFEDGIDAKKRGFLYARLGDLHD